MVEEPPLRAAQAARKLGFSTKELLRLVHERKIRQVMVGGVAHVLIDAADEHRSERRESSLPIPVRIGEPACTIWCHEPWPASLGVSLSAGVRRTRSRS
jgi:excisionase family DNA binding protein